MQSSWQFYHTEWMALTWGILLCYFQEKKTYSKDHINVGVVFASITNFNEFYEEQYAGGKECIRILNEIIGMILQFDSIYYNKKCTFAKLLVS